MRVTDLENICIMIYHNNSRLIGDACYDTLWLEVW
jgi:hypothetical protein